MEEHVSWVVELAVKDGKLDTFEELMQEMVEGTRAEPQALVYEWYVSEDGGTVHLFEKYADSDATIAHLNGFFERWAARFTDCADVTRFAAYGDPSDAAREILDKLGAVYMQPWGGFSRFA